MRFNNIAMMVALASVLFGSVACGDEPAPSPLDLPAGEMSDATYNSLSFTWEKVKDAVQYSYQLSESASGEIVSTDVTRQTNASFTGLEPSTDYTLTVLAYAAYDSYYTTSEPSVLTARTADLVAVGTPRPEMSRDVNTLYISWDYVDNADSYLWRLYDAAGNLLESGETSGYYVQFDDMKSGNFSFTVTALTSAPGFKDGETGRLDFEFVRERVEIWRLTGTYFSSLLEAIWNADLVAYDNGSYTIESWYGVEGYDFTFTVDGNGVFSCPSSVPTGLEVPAEVHVTAAGSSMEGNSANGKVTLSVSDGTDSGKDELSWSSETCSIDDLCGEWVRHYTCYDNYYEEGYDNTMSVTVTKVDDNTIRVPLPLYNDEYANVTVNLETMTYTLEPTAMNVGYVFASSAGENVAITGMISPTRFFVNNWGLFWGGYNDYVNTMMEFYRSEGADE